jgi:hypothetical protein
MAGPALARDRRPDRIRQRQDRGPSGRASGQPGRPDQGRGASDKEVRAIEAKFKAADDALGAKIAAVRAEYASLVDKVGVFEGAGYASKGLYRSMIYCLMIGNPKNEFCRVCQRAIARMIDFTCGRS